MNAGLWRSRWCLLSTLPSRSSFLPWWRRQARTFPSKSPQISISISMNTLRLSFNLAIALALSSAGFLPAQSTQPDRNASLRQEVELAIGKGLSFLKQQQNKETGAWSTPEEPAITALALAAFTGDPTRKPTDPLP